MGVLFGRFGGSPMAVSSWWDHHFVLLGGQGVDIQNFWITSMAFLDDLYFLSRSFDQAQVMLDELLVACDDAGLQPNLSKVNWMANKYVPHASELALTIGNVLIPVSQEVTVLGSIIRVDGHEQPAFHHRIQKGWACFHKWEHILCSSAPLPARLRFWSKVCEPSLLWGLQTVRMQNTKGLSALQFCQRMQIRKMLKLKRKPIGGHLEEWLDWQKRTLSKAGQICREFRIDIRERFLSRRVTWAGHFARLGVLSHVPHMAHFVLMWRPLFWWREQQFFSGITQDFVRHPTDWGQPRRYEHGWPTNWMVEALYPT